MRGVLTLLLLAAGIAPAFAADEDALNLADKAEMKAEKPSDWKIFAETGLRESARRSDGAALHAGRLSLDLRYDKVFAPGWRAVFADRLDMNRSYGAANDGNINTLKEAYLSWQAAPDRIADFGRINQRSGVATGYNPTDYIRAGALRSATSIDPGSLRENRLGSVMLRGQALWKVGSVTALVSPKLADAPNSGAYNLDLGATNQRTRWLVAASHKFSDAINPQFLLSGGQDQLAQLGFNLSVLANDATVVYAEWSGGRSKSLLSQALGGADDSAFRNRVATGLTYTTSGNLSLTAELDYNGAGLDRDGWNALRRGSPAAYGRYRTFASTAQDLATRRGAFFYASWTDAFVKHFDLNAMLRYDAVDSSRLQWVEARYHWTKVDLALQYQRNAGKPGSDYGAASETRIAQLLLRTYF
ncbi:MAG: hypothetical protein ABI831_28575 [Betaproteobacteria bacterium]